MHHEFTTHGSPTLVLALGGGHIEIEGTATADPDGTITVETDDGAGIVVEQRRQAVVIRTDRGGRLGHGIGARITVPTTTMLAGRLMTATLVQSGTIRNARLHNAAGSLTFGTVTESLVAKTGAGDISVEDVRGSAVIHTGAGRIEIGHAGGTTRLATGVGDIEVGRAEGLLDLKSGAGRLLVHRASGDVTLKSGTGPVDVRHFEGAHLTARNHSGDITVGIPAGLPVWRDIVTGTGLVASTLAPTGEPAKGARHAEIRAVTRHGDVTLRPSTAHAA